MREITKGSVSTEITPSSVLSTIAKHMLVDGFPIVVDLEKSSGCRLVDAATGRTFLDLFTFFASAPLGLNHPKMIKAEVRRKLELAAVNKPSNSDFYTVFMAEFVETADRYAIPKELPNLFLISGGALAVENALKAAFDWKVRKNYQKGAAKETGTKVIHFKEAFHGRTGYTLSLTNTDPIKTDYFPKFDWPRISNPKVRFPLNAHLSEVQKMENQAKSEIEQAISEHGADIAALIIEPIQGEGGDNHFRPEFLQFLRKITEENDIIFICDEVQSGVGMTGKFWAYEHAGIIPDIIAFGKKMQICGIMASDKLNEVDGVFKVSSRINSTWGGNLADMVRAKHYLEIIHEDNLIDNARDVGQLMLDSLTGISEIYPEVVTNVRGKGFMIAFDLPDVETRGKFIQKAFEKQVIVAVCGTRSVRFRPALSLTRSEAEEGMGIIGEALKEVLG